MLKLLDCYFSFKDALPAKVSPMLISCMAAEIWFLTELLAIAVALVRSSQQVMHWLAIGTFCNWDKLYKDCANRMPAAHIVLSIWKSILIAFCCNTTQTPYLQIQPPAIQTLSGSHFQRIGAQLLSFSRVFGVRVLGFGWGPVEGLMKISGTLLISPQFLVPRFIGTFPWFQGIVPAS